MAGVVAVVDGEAWVLALVMALSRIYALDTYTIVAYVTAFPIVYLLPVVFAVGWLLVGGLLVGHRQSTPLGAVVYLAAAVIGVVVFLLTAVLGVRMVPLTYPDPVTPVLTLPYRLFQTFAELGQWPLSDALRGFAPVWVNGAGLVGTVSSTLIGAFQECDFESIVCTDPHSYNTITNEYSDIDFSEFADDPMMEAPVDGYWNEDGAVDVYHYTQVVEDLVQDGHLDLGSIDRTVTYHDPCHLGRYNGEYEAPREVVRATGVDLVEMPRNRSDSFCCGGGGGGLWMEVSEETKPSEERLREAVEDTATNGAAVEQFVVACPMCVTMFEDGRKTGGFEDDLEIVDTTELLVEAIEAR